MDGPFLARWLLGLHRPPEDLLDDLRLFLPDRLLADVAAALADPP